MKISVIVPVYNAEKYLKRCIDSIINQTFQELEIILVDDGSTDLSGKICDNYKDKDSRIKVIHQKNGGASIARNEGLKVATGDYVSFIDSDDYIDLSLYEKFINNYDSADIFVFNYYTVKKLNQELGIVNQVDKNFYHELTKNNSIRGFVWNKIYKRNLLKKINFNTDITFCEDLLFNYSIINNKEDIKMKYFNEPLYYYVMINNNYSKYDKNTSRLFALKNISKILESHKKYIDIYNDVCFIFAKELYAHEQLNNVNNAEKAILDDYLKDSFKNKNFWTITKLKIYMYKCYYHLFKNK